MSQQKSGDGAKTSKYDDICPICGKNRQENPDCRKKAKLNLCPAKDEQCHNNHKKTIDGKEEIARKGCSSSNSGSKGNGIRLGYNILSGSDWAPGINAKKGAPVKLFKQHKYQHYLYAGSRSIAAHHLICSEAIDNNEQWKKILEMTGYNINCRWNGVFLPATAALACHTGLQRHDGPHDLGNAGGVTYVDAVKDKLESIITEFRKANKNEPCSENSTAQIIKSLNALSEEILENVKSFTWTIAWDGLTYDKKGKLRMIGCANSKTIDDKVDFLKKKLNTELEAKGIKFTKKNKNFSDMQELAKVRKKVLKTAKCEYDRNHHYNKSEKKRTNEFPDIRPKNYMLTIGH